MTLAWQREHSGGTRGSSLHDAPAVDEVFCRSLATHWQGDFSAKTRLLVICSHHDATLDISFLRPFAGDTGKASGNTAVVVLDENALSSLYAQTAPASDHLGLAPILACFNPTHVVICRYWGARSADIKAELRQLNIPVITFLDDDLFHVPLEAGQNVFAFFNDPDRRRTLQMWVEEADLLLVSTPQLAKSLKRLRKTRPMEVCEIYRSVTDEEFALIPGLSEDEDVIGYMGSQSHADDLDLWVPSLVSLMQERPTLRFETFGTIPMPIALKAFGDRVHARGKAASYDEFINTLRMTQWSLGLAPLAETAFNANKACTKWVEYTLAGIPTLASPGPVYASAISRQACAATETDTVKSAITRLLDNPDARASLLSSAVKELKNNYKVVQHQRFLLKVLKSASRKSST